MKIEINCFEHFNELGLVKVPFSVENSWFSGSCDITTYRLDELLGTKLRALYQRKKGRDLFDLRTALTTAEVNPVDVIRCYKRYMEFSVPQSPTYKQFILNMEEKMADPFFVEDTQSLLRPGQVFDHVAAYVLVKERLLDRLQK